MDGLKSAIQKEVSTGVIRGASYGEIAKRIEKRMVGDYKKFNGGTYAKAARIARTEGHRVQNTAAYDAQKAAQSKGANIVKQWDATLDARTRDSHAKVDGELTAVDEKFSNGLMFPGDPHGAAAEVCNCRCALLQRAKWALDADELERLKQRAEYYGLDKADSFEEFKQKYLECSGNTWYNGGVKGKAVKYNADTIKPYEIKIPRDKKKSIIEHGVSEKQPIFAYDTDKNRFASYVRNVPKEDGYYDVAMHGADTYVEFFGEPIDAYTLSQIIRQRNDYIGGTPIRLLSCSTGNIENTGECVAQIVSNELGVVVKAPTDALYVSENGTLRVGFPKSEKMKLFYPRK